MKTDRFFVRYSKECGNPHIIKPRTKTDKVSWKYKRCAIKAFIKRVVNSGWYEYTNFELGKPCLMTIQLVDVKTKDVLCEERLHLDEGWEYLPRYSIVTIDPMAQEYYGN